MRQTTGVIRLRNATASRATSIVQRARCRRRRGESRAGDGGPPRRRGCDELWTAAPVRMPPRSEGGTTAIRRRSAEHGDRPSPRWCGAPRERFGAVQDAAGYDIRRGVAVHVRAIRSRCTLPSSPCFGREVTTGGRGNVGATVGAAGQTPAAVRFELAAAASGSPGVPRLPACSVAGRACAGHDGSTCARARPRRPLPVGPAKTRALVPVRSTSAPFRGRSRVAFPECSSSRKNR